MILISNLLLEILNEKHNLVTSTKAINSFNYEYRSKKFKELKASDASREDIMKDMATEFIKKFADINNIGDYEVYYLTVPDLDTVKVKGKNINGEIKIPDFKVISHTLQSDSEPKSSERSFYNRDPEKKNKKIDKDSKKSKETPSNSLKISKDDEEIVAPYEGNRSFWKIKLSDFNAKNKKIVAGQPEKSKGMIKAVATRLINHIESSMELPENESDIEILDAPNGKTTIKKGQLFIKTTINPTTYFVNPENTNVSYGKIPLK